MTDLRRSNAEVRIHQQQQQQQKQQQSFCDSFRSSCNSTPEPTLKTYPTSAAAAAAHAEQQQLLHLTNGHRNPLLKSLADHANMGSTSGGSTTSSTTTTATATTIGRNCNSNGNGNISGGCGEIQFDEREIYYVSPSKRKGSFCGGGSAAPLRSSMRACERLRSFSPTTAAATAASMSQSSYPSATPSTAYGARAAGSLGQDMSFESYEVSSHYSDTAMQVLRSGSCSGIAGGLMGGGSNLVTTAAGNCNSSNSSLAQQHLMPAQRIQNNVTFANFVSEQRPPVSQPPSNRGSLRRNKGRSNQSLCSCDAGADTVINPDPTRPLYQYSLERRQKAHTYTCEQNAQILMRLERERNRKLSQSCSKEDVQSDTPSSSDVDTIPPVPPPPSMKRNGSMRSLRLLQMQQHQQQQRPSSTCSMNNNMNHNNNNNIISSQSNNTIATLCSGDILNDCANSSIDVGSVIDDCTTSILKCANAVGAEIMATTNGVHKSTSNNIATLATMASQAKPDVCHVGNHATTSFSNYPPPCIVRDDIFMPNSKKLDPSLCFLHAGPHGIGAGAGSNGPADLSLSSSSKPQRDPHKQHNSRNNILSLSKYNTIGPSSDYARHLSHYNQQLQQHQRISERCRCFSQSFSNFSRDYFGQQHQQQQHSSSSMGIGGGRGAPANRSGDNHATKQQHSIFHTGGSCGHDENDWLGGVGVGFGGDGDGEPPLISRSYSNLVDIDGRHTTSSRLPYQKFQTPADVFSSSCSFSAAANLLNNASFTTLSSSTNSGLKEKLHQQQQQQHSHHLHSHQLPSSQSHQHHLHQQQQHQHNHQQLQHQQPGVQQQKHHQLHSSITSIMPWKHRQCPSRGSSSSGTNSFRFDAAKHWLAVSSILLIIGAASVAVPLALRVAASAPFEERLRVAVQLLDQVPLIDGHNDLPWNIRKFLHNKLNDFNFDEDLRNVMPWARSHWSHTDLQRLKKGRISAQFWAAYVPCEAQHRDAVQLTLEQIDVIKRLTDRYSPQLTTCTSSEDIIEAHKNHQLCSLTGVEGGHSLGGSLAVLRTLYAIGVRYMTLTSTCHTPWADSSYADAPAFNIKHGGLTIFGKTIIREMNRLGMMVDLSHVSTGTMRDALEVTEAPVIFSHSSAYELCNSSRNVQNDMLQSLAKNGGLVMVNFYSKFLSCSENSTVHDAVAHINHIKRIAGIDHVGLGAGYDGINFTPKGLEDVSSYPTLFAELLGEGWSIDDLTKLAGGNFLRVMQKVEKIRDEKKLAGIKPYEDHPNFRTDDPYNCTSS